MMIRDLLNHLVSTEAAASKELEAVLVAAGPAVEAVVVAVAAAEVDGEEEALGKAAMAQANRRFKNWNI